MSHPEPPVDDLRRHLDDVGEAGASCPPSEDWWRAWRTDLSQREFEALLDHAATCASCSHASRVAREMVRRLEPERFRGRPARATRRLVPMAAAAVVLLAVVGLAITTWRERGRSSDLRGATAGALESLLDESRPLSRSACVLRWTAGPEGTVYHVVVTDDAMRPLATGRSLARPEFLVDEQALAALPRGATIAWQVRAIAPDGRQTVSHTFFGRLD